MVFVRLEKGKKMSKEWIISEEDLGCDGAYFSYEEVVRCKNCKFFDHSDFGKGEEYWCKHFASTYDTTHCHRVMEDDFCSWGEKRENE